MRSKNNRLKATPAFWADFDDVIDYITETLENPIAAEFLLDSLVKKARALEASPFPAATKPYFAPPEVDLPYYALPVGNYLAFYVVLDDVIEFRRFLYARSDLSHRLGPK